MKRKIVGIFVLMLLIATAIPGLGIVETNEQDDQKYVDFYEIQKDANEIIPLESLDQLDRQATTVNAYHKFCGSGTTRYDLAQSFKPTLPELTRVQIKLKKYGNPTMTYFDVGIKPSLDYWMFLTWITIPVSSLPSGEYWLNCDFSDISVTPGNNYYIMVFPQDGTLDLSNYISWCYGTPGPYSNGNGYKRLNDLSWNPLGDFGDDFCFKTYGTDGTNTPPNTPSQPNGPSSGAVNEWLSYTTSATDDDNDLIRYAFDKDNDGIVDHWSSFYIPSGATYQLNVQFDTPGTYHLRFKARDKHGAESAWSPSKQVIISAANNAPNTPATPIGDTSGEIGTTYSYTTSADDPDGDQVKYRFDWNASGTQEYSGWTSLGVSGHSDSLSHSWTTPRTYEVKAQAQDENGAESAWSSALTVTITLANNPPNRPACTYERFSDQLRVSATDPDGDKVRYGMDWEDDDGTIDQWTAYVTSGTEQIVNCGGRTGPFGVIAEDEHGEQSNWVSISAKIKVDSIFTLFFKFLEQHPYLYNLMKNMNLI